MPSIEELVEQAREYNNGNFFGVTRTSIPAIDWSYFQPTPPRSRWWWSMTNVNRPNAQQIPRERAPERIRGLSYDTMVHDECRVYDERASAALYAYQWSGIPTTRPSPAFETQWAAFSGNWLAIGQQHERRVYCQPLLSA